jgi:AcrR family transcriptional regulator
MNQPDHPTRQRIQIAAEPLFAALGYDGVSLRAIAAKAEVQLGLIPYHFGSKEGLYRAIWQRWMSQIPVSLLLSEVAPAPDAPLDAQIRSVVQAFFNGPRTILRQPGGKHFVAIMVSEVHSPLAGERGLVAEFIRPNSSMIHDSMRALLPDLAPDIFAAGMAMMVSALRIVIEHDHGQDAMAASFEALFDSLTDYLVGGWMTFVCSGG